MATELLRKPTWQILSEEFACNHEASIMVRYVDASGTTSVRYQCQRCGAYQGAVKKKDVADVNSLSTWDESLRDRWQQARNDRGDEINKPYFDRINSQRENAETLWWQNYTTYLCSPEWHALRQFVLKRDNYVCQGCCRRFEQHQLVCHHKSYVGYNRIGKTFAFEVVTLCRQCHDEWHQIEQDYNR